MRSRWARLGALADRVLALDIAPALALPAVGALALGLSLLRIGRLSLSHDEAITFYLVTGPWDAFLDAITHRESFAALHYLLLRPWTALGDSEAVLRSLSAVLAVLTVALTYRIGQALFDRRVALAGAVLLAVNAFMVRFAQDARAYALAAFAVALATLLLIRVIERPSRLRWLGYAVACVLAVYAHFLSVFVLAAHVVALLVAGRERVRASWAMAAGALVALASAPLAVSMALYGPERDFIPATTRGVVRDVLEQLAGGGTEPGTGGLSLLALYGALVVLAGVAAARALTGTQRDRAWRYALAFGWALLPLALSIGLSRLQPTFVGRYQLVALPGLALLGGIAIASLQPRRVAAVGLILAVLLATRGLVWWYTEPQKEDWRRAAQIVVPRAEQADALVFYEFWGWRAFEYHAERDGGPGLVPKRFQVPPDPVEAWYKATDLANGYARVWILVADADATTLPDGLAAVERGMRARYRLVEWQRVYGIEIRLYERLAEDAWEESPPPA